MSIQEVMQAARNGRSVKWHHDGYDVILDSLDRFLVVCRDNQYTTFLYESDAKDCYIADVI
ncbi:MAG: hypothetical protein VXB01_01430 [Opitutae bacterium]|jgi:hypothetical protein